MSNGDYQTESRSSVQVNCTAKGDPQISVKVYVGDDAAQVEAAKDLALRVYAEAMKAVGR